MIYNSIIIGGGSAGLFIAANLSGDKNLLLEGTKKLGQKILITGGGMCNITNRDDTDEFLSRFGDKKKINFLKPALLNLTTEDTYNWLTSKGLELTIREDGKVFPKSLKSQSLIDTLQREAAQNGLQFKYNSKVKSTITTDGLFEVKTTDSSYVCRNLIFATGGKSFPKTGSDGTGYKLIQSLGHKIIDPTPSLTAVKILNYPFKKLAGSSIKGANIDFYRDEETKRYLNTTGDILFTHHGLSGPAILNNSRNIKDSDLICASLIPCDNKEDKRAELLDKLSDSGNKSLKRVLKEFGMTSALTDMLLSILKLDAKATPKVLGKKYRNRIINSILNFNFTVLSKVGFSGAMATAGGVDIKEINRKTMESKIVPNLYFAGEVIDIDGDTGGYNIQAAFSTGMLVADSINGKEK